MKEKRKEARVKKYFAINIIALDAKGRRMRFDTMKASPKFCDESGLDLSPAGIKIMCSKPLPEEAKIQMKMLVPDEKGLNLIKANGTIKWFKQVKGKYKKFFIIGVRFRDLEESDRKKLISLWKKYYK